jgi:ATP cone domain
MRRFRGAVSFAVVLAIFIAGLGSGSAKYGGKGYNSLVSLFSAVPPTAADISGGSIGTEQKGSPGPKKESQTYVIKRDGRKQPVSFDKITKRIVNLCHGLNKEFVDPVLVAQGTVRGLYSGVTTSELDNLASETAAYMSTVHPDYAKLASRIAISNLQKDTPAKFSEVIELLHQYVDPKSGLPAGFISEKLYEKVKKNAEKIDAYIKHSRDFHFDYFGFKTMER